MMQLKIDSRQVQRETEMPYFPHQNKHTFAKLLKLPKVTNPLLRAGAAETEPASEEGV